MIKTYIALLQIAFEDDSLPEIEDFKLFIQKGNARSKLLIPPMYPLCVPKNFTFRGTNNLTMTHRCRKDLTDEHFSSAHSVGALRAGFYKMNKKYSLQDAKKEIQLLSEKTKRKFRLGTAAELICHIQGEHESAHFFVALHEMWNAHALCYDLWFEKGGFDLCLYGHGFSSSCKIFIVEEL